MKRKEWRKKIKYGQEEIYQSEKKIPTEEERIHTEKIPIENSTEELEGQHLEYLSQEIQNMSNKSVKQTTSVINENLNLQTHELLTLDFSSKKKKLPTSRITTVSHENLDEKPKLTNCDNKANPSLNLSRSHLNTANRSNPSHVKSAELSQGVIKKFSCIPINNYFYSLKSEDTAENKLKVMWTEMTQITHLIKVTITAKYFYWKASSTTGYVSLFFFFMF